MKVLILAGGLGTRLREETEYRPKPMVRVGNKPVIWHIMKTYASYGFNDFIICLGYKGEMIKDYFLNYKMMNCDVTIRLGDKESLEIHNNHEEIDWTITLASTGEKTQTGARIKKVEKYVKDDLFMVTYGDGVSNIDIRKLVEFHKSHGKIGTMSGVHPSSRFGEFSIKNNQVIDFHEKPQTKEGLINGGFFVFDKSFFKYLSEDDNCTLEKKPLEMLVSDGQLMVYPHDGFWQCVDTYRELELLNQLWDAPHPPWKVW
jgi:glucose-1-phosphate cytidylyltransferase